MIGNPQVLAALQQAAAREAHLNLQYRQDWRSVKFMGARKVAKQLDAFGHDAHRFLKKLTDRILFLEGKPGYSIPAVTEQANFTDLLKNELALEIAIVQPYEDAVALATEARDDTTRNLFEHLLKWHEEHVGWLEQQINLVAQMGVNEYIAEKL